MSQLINEAQRFQKLAGLINENQLDEALNKDMRSFGQDVDKRLKEAGFKTLVLIGQDLKSDQIQKIRNESGLVAFEVKRQNGTEGEIQQMYLYCNPKEFQKVKKVIDKFQLSNYEGQKKFNDKNWTTKTVMGAINPGDIVKTEDPSSGQIWFFRYEKVERKLKTSGGGTDRQYSGGGASYDVTKMNTAQQKISEIESSVNEALTKFRKQK